MKLLRFITLLTLISVGNLTIFAATPPDRRQQKYQALRAAKYLAKMGQEQKARFIKRHQVKNTTRSLNSRQQALLSVLTIIMLLPTVTAMKVSEKLESAGQPSESLVRLMPYKKGQEQQTYGPCETLTDKSNFCCDIGKNYTVTCCHHPQRSGFSRCLSFDPNGFIGGTPESHSDDALVDLSDRICGATSEHRITKEATELVRKEDAIKKICTEKLAMELYTPPTLIKMTKEISRKLHIKTPEVVITYHGPAFHWGHSYYNRYQACKNRRVVPYLFRSNVTDPEEIRKYVDDVSNDDICSLEAIKALCSSSNEIVFPPETMYQPDGTIASILAHELMHAKQLQAACVSITISSNKPRDTWKKIYSFNSFEKINNAGKVGNNFEAEADIAPALTKEYPCVIINFYDEIVNIVKFHDEVSKHCTKTYPDERTALALRMRDESFKFSRENAEQFLSVRGYDPHPLHPIRILMILAMNKYYNEALKLLTPAQAICVK